MNIPIKRVYVYVSLAWFVVGLFYGVALGQDTSKANPTSSEYAIQATLGLPWFLTALLMDISSGAMYGVGSTALGGSPGSHSFGETYAGFASVILVFGVVFAIVSILAVAFGLQSIVKVATKSR